MKRRGKGPTSKDHHYSSKRPVILANVPKCPFDSFGNVSMLHWGFIPENNLGLSDKLCKVCLRLDRTEGVGLNIDWDLEPRMSSTTSLKGVLPQFPMKRQQEQCRQ